MAVRFREPRKRVPEQLDTDGRESYIQIATRAQAEAVNRYTVLALGLQAYMNSRRASERALCVCLPSLLDQPQYQAAQQPR